MAGFAPQQTASLYVAPDQQLRFGSLILFNSVHSTSAYRCPDDILRPGQRLVEKRATARVSAVVTCFNVCCVEDAVDNRAVVHQDLKVTVAIS